LARYRYNARLPDSPEILGKTGFVANGLVAQSVEQRIENPCVGGSIPPRATNIRKPTVLGWLFSYQHNPHILRDLARFCLC
jgi:hypothetical protein